MLWNRYVTDQPGVLLLRAYAGFVQKKRFGMDDFSGGGDERLDGGAIEFVTIVVIESFRCYVTISLGLDMSR